MGIVPGMASDAPTKKKGKAKNTKPLASKDLIKEFGAGAFITGDQLETNEILHVSPRIDLLLGGGIPGGSVVTIVGPPKCGKTVTSLHILGKAQQIGRPAVFLNVEGRIKPRDLAGISCLDASNLHIVRSYRDSETGKTRILEAHEFLQAAEDAIHNRPGAVVVIDSVSQFVTGGEMENELNKQDRAPGATLLSKFCRRLSNVIPVNDIILIGVLQYYANTSGYGKTKVVGGGNKIKYALDIGLECHSFEFVREGGTKEGRPVGQSVEWITTSTAFAPPGQRASSMITFGTGIDELYEMVDMGIELGFILQAGAWYTLSYMEDVVGKEWNDKQYKEQGKEKLVNRLRTNVDEREALEKAFHEMMGLEQ